MEDLILKKKLVKIMTSQRTILGAGPMSLNSINAVDFVSKKNKVPIFLICSRRQIDSKFHGGGYVNNWSTEDLSHYLKKKKNNNVILCRDHGGPWQNNKEIKKKLNLKQAMISAKKSFEDDIDNDFKIIHIDPSLNIDGKNSLERVIDLIMELYQHCYEYALKKKKKILFEIGTEEQTGFSDNFIELENLIDKITKKLLKKKLPKPVFMVAQTGTRVLENKNIGSLDFPDQRLINELPAEITIPKVSKMFERYGIYIKQHNSDYLSAETLKWLPRLGIHAINVAPEFGYIESLEYSKLLKELKLKKHLDTFYEIAYNSKKWVKWMSEKESSDEFKSLLCGHYIYSDEKFLESKNEVKEILKKRKINLDYILESKIREKLSEYIKSLNFFS